MVCHVFLGGHLLLISVSFASRLSVKLTASDTPPQCLGHILVFFSSLAVPRTRSSGPYHLQTRVMLSTIHGMRIGSRCFAESRSSFRGVQGGKSAKSARAAKLIVSMALINARSLLKRANTVYHLLINHDLDLYSSGFLPCRICPNYFHASSFEYLVAPSPTKLDLHSPSNRLPSSFSVY